MSHSCFSHEEKKYFASQEGALMVCCGLTFVMATLLCPVSEGHSREGKHEQKKQALGFTPSVSVSLYVV